MPLFKRTYVHTKGAPKVVWSYSFAIDKVKYQKNGFSTQKEAKDAEMERWRAVTHRMNKPVAIKNVSFELWLPEFIKYRTTMRKSPNTISHEAARGKALCKHFGNRLITNIDIPDIEAFVKLRRDSGVSSRTINLELTFLRTFFKNAMNHYVAKFNPAREVTNLPEDEDKEEVWIPTREEFMRFVKVAETLSTSAVFVPWLWFRAYTGTRPAESMFMEWKDIDFENNCIWVRPKIGNPLKNRKKRRIPLHPELKPILLAWRTEWEKIQNRRIGRNERQGLSGHRTEVHDWVFFHPHNHGDKVERYLRSFEQARKLSGLPKMKPYTLRHYFISVCLMSTRDLYAIAKWTGHKNIKMIQEVYGHLFDDYSAGEMAKVKVRPDLPGDSPKTGEETSRIAPVPIAESGSEIELKPDLALVSGDD